MTRDCWWACSLKRWTIRIRLSHLAWMQTKIHAGIELCLKQMAGRGWQADVCLIQPDATAGPAVEQRLRATMYDCVVIGAGRASSPAQEPHVVRNYRQYRAQGCA